MPRVRRGRRGRRAHQDPLSPVGAARIRWGSIVSTLVAAVALLVAQDTGYAATLGVTLALALALAWGWPRLTGSWTPAATTVVLGVASVAIVLSALREDLLWMPAAVAFGIVLAFFGQLVRRTGREGLVLTLLSSFGGLAAIYLFSWSCFPSGPGTPASPLCAPPTDLCRYGSLARRSCDGYGPSPAPARPGS